MSFFILILVDKKLNYSHHQCSKYLPKPMSCYLLRERELLLLSPNIWTSSHFRHGPVYELSPALIWIFQALWQWDLKYVWAWSLDVNESSFKYKKYVTQSLKYYVEVVTFPQKTWCEVLRTEYVSPATKKIKLIKSDRGSK